jgi:flagellar protein FlaG
MTEMSIVNRPSTPQAVSTANVVSHVAPERNIHFHQPSSNIATKDVKAAVAQINDYVQSVQRDLQFSFDDELGATVVRVIDRRSGELIRQIPNDVALDLARNLKEKMDIQILEASG